MLNNVFVGREPSDFLCFDHSAKMAISATPHVLQPEIPQRYRAIQSTKKDKNQFDLLNFK